MVVEGFLACSLDMGQEINGTSNTNANSVSRAAHTAHMPYNSHAGMLGIDRSDRDNSSPPFFDPRDWKEIRGENFSWGFKGGDCLLYRFVMGPNLSITLLKNLVGKNSASLREMKVTLTRVR